MRSLCLILLVFIYLCYYINSSTACQNYRTLLNEDEEEEQQEDDEGMEDERRRRSSLRGGSSGTEELREYFTTCMEILLPGATYDWRSCVDFTILDTLWYLNTEQTYCSPAGDGDTLECWQDEITNFLKGSSNRVLETTQTCIANFAEDKNSVPPKNRYKYNGRYRNHRSTRTSSSSSSSSFEESSSYSSYFSSSYSYQTSTYGFTYLPKYTDCLTTVRFDDGRAPLNFMNLSLFVDENTVDGCNGRRPSRRGPTWPYRFVSLTRPDSVLRQELEVCAKRIYPPAPYWASWGAYGECSVSCGKGRQIRRRTCRSGVDPNDFSSECEGSGSESRPCVATTCPRAFSYSWGEWGPHSTCSKSCGGGFQSKRRPCRRNGHVVQAQHCSNLTGPRSLRRSCNSRQCPEKYMWTSWSPYSRCRVQRETNNCRRGFQIRSRRCRKGSRQVSSQNCNGQDTQRRQCFMQCLHTSSSSSSSSSFYSRFSHGHSSTAG